MLVYTRGGTWWCRRFIVEDPRPSRLGKLAGCIGYEHLSLHELGKIVNPGRVVDRRYGHAELRGGADDLIGVLTTSPRVHECVPLAGARETVGACREPLLADEIGALDHE